MIRTNVLATALALDFAIGDPLWLPHPVRAIGAAVTACDRISRDCNIREDPVWGRIAGVVTTVTIVGASYGITRALVQKTGRVGTALETILAASALAWRSLIDEAASVELSLVVGDVPRARERLARIVGRDTQNLNESEIARATIETLAESFCDGIVAPLCYLIVGGAPLALAYKSTNTLDSMIGHKEAPYRAFGWFAARFDDAANFVPARLSALAIIAASSLALGRSSQSLQICMRDSRLHRSPNAGWPEAAIAGALGVRLGGSNTYGGEKVTAPFLGPEFRVPNSQDVRRARNLICLAAALIAGTALALLKARDAFH